MLIRSSFILVCLYRLINHQFTRHHHFGFEHFVDVVYLLLCIDEDLNTDPGILSQRLNYLCLPDSNKINECWPMKLAHCTRT